MNYSLRKYQQIAVEESGTAFAKIEELKLTDPKGKYGIQIEAPTGAGKTVILGHLLKTVLKNYTSIVLSPGSGNLEEQTLQRLSGIAVGRVQRLDTNVIKNPSTHKGEIYVSNWEALVSKADGNAYKTKLSRTQESANFWDLISFFKANDMELAIIIDESHHGAKSAGGSIATFLDDITKVYGRHPLFIEASATPITSGGSYKLFNKVFINTHDVIAEGMLRKNVFLNDGIQKYCEDLPEEVLLSESSEHTIVKAALLKQKLIDAEYKKIGSNQHCLIAIQLPNSKEGLEARKRIEPILFEAGITYDKDNVQGSLGSYMDGVNGKMGDFANIAKADSPLKVIFYKQGISLGWDCPRAQVLVGFRHLKSAVFTKQNLGRFVRTTEAKHYENDILDSTYVFTNTKDDLGTAGYTDALPDGVNQITEHQYRVETNGRRSLSTFDALQLEGTYTVRNFKETLDMSDVTALWKATVDAKLFAKALAKGKITTESLSAGTMKVEDLLNKKEGDAGESFTDTGINLFSSDLPKKEFQAKLTDTIIKIGGERFNPAVGRFLEYFVRLVESYMEKLIYGKPSDNKAAHYGLASHLKLDVSVSRTAYVYWVLLEPNNYKLLYKALEQIIPKVTVRSEKISTNDEEEMDSEMWSTKSYVYTPHEEETIRDFHSDLSPKANGAKINSDLYAFSRELGGSYRTEVASGPELAFEKEIQTFKNAKLISFAKNSLRYQGEGLSLVIKHEDKLARFFPDYLVEFEVEGKVFPAILEVKDAELNNGLGSDGRGSSLRKAASLVSLSKKYKAENLKAAVVYPDKLKGWVAITEILDGNPVTIELEEFLLS